MNVNAINLKKYVGNYDDYTITLSFTGGSASIDFGDGTPINTYHDEVTYTYAESGNYDIAVIPLSSIVVFKFDADELVTWGTDLVKKYYFLTNYPKFPDYLAPWITDLSYMFYYDDDSGAGINGVALSNWDTSNVTNMSYMFYNRSGLNGVSYDGSIDYIKNWNTSNVTDMSYMFVRCRSFDSDLSGWNTSNVTNMSHMFDECYPVSSFKYWDTSNVTDMSYMFNLSVSLEFLDLSLWDTSKVTNMSHMFNECYSFNSDLSLWNTSNVTDMSYMFKGCYNFFAMDSTNQKASLEKWDTSKVTNMSHMFHGCYNGVSFNMARWNTSSVTDMSYMFYGCYYVTHPTHWNTSKVTNMSYMFYQCYNFTSDLSSWDVSKVTNMDSMFYACTNFISSLESWCVPLIPSLPNDFLTGPWGDAEDAEQPSINMPEWGTCPSDDDSGVEGLVFSVQDINSNGTEFGVWANRGDKPTNPTWYLKNLTEDTIVASADGFVADGYTVTNDINILNITIPLTPNVTRYTFTEAAAYAGFGYYSDNDHTDDYPPNPDYVGLLPEINLTVESFSTTIDNIEFFCDFGNITVPEYLPPNMTDLDYMFESCYLFNQDISMWDTRHVTTMVRTFCGTSLFNQDLSTWDVSNVTDMSLTFSSTASFNQDLSDWDVSNVTDMGNMFSDATSFNGDVSTWNTSNTTDMNCMFDGATLFNSNISNWDTSKVTEMARMFHNATTFNQDLSQWCVSNIPTKPDTFDTAATSWTLPKPVWGTCPERLPTPS